MQKIKNITTYFLWTILSIVCAFAYLRIVLGTVPTPTTDIGEAVFYTLAFFALQLGLILGFIIALVFVLTDIFYLKKKLENKPFKILIRFGVILSITVLVGIIHYILEKVVNVI